MKTNDKNKLQWGATLKPGDVVEDCRYRHSKIKTIVPVTIECAGSSEHGNIVDFVIVFDDGQECSLMHCCDKVK